MADRPQGLSRQKTASALRAFIYTGGMWGAWGQMVGIGTAAFTGFALWMGATDAQIAYFVSIAFLTGLIQMVAPYVTERVSSRKRMLLVVGMLEILLRSSIVLVPLIFHESGRIFAVGAIMALGLLCGQFNSPVYNTWLATIIPEGIRGRFIGRQTIASLVCGIAAGYVVGYYIDLFEESDRYTGFLTVFGAAVVLGIAGYVNIMRVPFQTDESAPRARLSDLLSCFHDSRFRRLLTFFLLWNFGVGLAGPFYSVFMLKNLGISYTNVAVLNSLFMASMVVGYRVWGGLVDRYGSKAILQIMALPAALVPLLWILNRPDSYWLVPAAMLLSGLTQSGIIVSVSPLLYSILPQGGQASYFASWSCAIQLAMAVAPLIGGALVETFASTHFVFVGFPIGSVQIVFLVSGAALLLPPLFLRSVDDARGTTPGQLLGQVGRGNLLSYLYGSLVYGRTEDERSRARAARRMGRSRSPMALDHLIVALDDASPEVRRQAARGLGEARSREALSPLLEEMADDESDIRSEAIEALGKIGDPSVLDPILNALDDQDPRVQISAIRALSEIGGAEAHELLFWKFADRFDRSTFPTLADALGEAGDLRMIRPTLERLANFRSPPIRLQLLNSVCRAQGARRRFYRLTSMDELTRAERAHDMLRDTARELRRTRLLGRDIRQRISEQLQHAIGAFDADESDGFLEATMGLLDQLEEDVGSEEVAAIGSESAERLGAAILAVRTFAAVVDDRTPRESRDCFVVVCLWCLGDVFKSAR
jgi:MFS family permease